MPKTSQILINDKFIKTLEKPTNTAHKIYWDGKTQKPLQDIKRFWSTLCKNAQIENLHIHDLRHTFASILANNGIDLHQTGKLLGHSNSRTTERYSHLHNNTLRNASELVGGVVMGKIK